MPKGVPLNPPKPKVRTKKPVKIPAKFKSTWETSPARIFTPIDPGKANRGKELQKICDTLGFASLSPMQVYMHQIFTQKKDTVRSNGPHIEPQFKRFLLLVPRQTGKTEVVASPVVLDRLINYQNQVVLWSAQTAEAVIQLFNTKIIPRFKASGLYEELGMKWKPSFPNPNLWVEATQSYVLILSNSDDSGRGLSTNLIVMDEVRSLKNTARDESLMPSTITNKDGQVLFISTAGNHKSEYLRRKTEAGRLAATKDSSRFGYSEWSAQEDDDFYSDETLIKANPSLGYSADIADIKDVREMMDDEGNILGFAAEYLNVWRSQRADAIIPIELWRAVEVNKMSLTDFGHNPVIAFHIEEDHIRDTVSVAIAGNGHISLESTTLPIRKFRAGLRELKEKHPYFNIVVVRMFSRLENRLVQFKPGYHIDKVYYNKSDYATGCNKLLDDIVAENVKIKASGGALWAAIQSVGKQMHWDLFTWKKEVRDVNIAPLIAVTLAYNEACRREARGVPQVRVLDI